MEYIYIGKIVNTHGIKGELRILSDFLSKDKVFIPGNTLYIGDNKVKEIIKTYRHHKIFDMVTFNGYDNINEVLKYLKQAVYVKRSDLKLDSQEYVLEELIGFDVVENSKVLGKVDKIVYNNSNVLLYINGRKAFYIPNQPYYIKNVDLKNKTVNVLNTEGLII